MPVPVVPCVRSAPPVRRDAPTVAEAGAGLTGRRAASFAPGAASRTRSREDRPAPAPARPAGATGRAAGVPAGSVSRYGPGEGRTARALTARPKRIAASPRQRCAPGTRPGRSSRAAPPCMLGPKRGRRGDDGARAQAAAAARLPVPGRVRRGARRVRGLPGVPVRPEGARARRRRRRVLRADAAAAVRRVPRREVESRDAGRAAAPPPGRGAAPPPGRCGSSTGCSARSVSSGPGGIGRS